MQLRRPLLALLVGLGGASWAPHAHADAAADLATARAFGVEGVALADAGKCGPAVEKLLRAEALHHAPTTAARLGECEIATGHLVRGTERLNRVVREPLGPTPPPVFAAAVSRAGRVLEATLPRIATLRLSLEAPPGARVSITIDGEPVPNTIVGGLRPIDPGTHRIEVTAPGYFTAEASTKLREGQTERVSLTLKRDPNAVLPTTDTSASGEGQRHRSVLPYVVYGIGAVGLTVGVAGAIVVSRKSSALNDACDANKVCPPSKTSDISDAKTWATTSTIAFGVAGAALVTGTVLLLTSSDSKTHETAKRVVPTVGVGSVGLTGVF